MITWYVLKSKSTLRKQTVLEKNPPPLGQSIAKRTTITANLKQMTAQQVRGWPTALLCLMCATQQQKEGVLHPEGAGTTGWLLTDQITNKVTRK